MTHDLLSTVLQGVLYPPLSKDRRLQDPVRSTWMTGNGTQTFMTLVNKWVSSLQINNYRRWFTINDPILGPCLTTCSVRDIDRSILPPTSRIPLSPPSSEVRVPVVSFTGWKVVLIPFAVLCILPNQTYRVVMFNLGASSNRNVWRDYNPLSLVSLYKLCRVFG